MLPIYGLQKTTLLDFPGHVASTIFLGHCNFRCPFCHNASLLTPTDNNIPYTWDSILIHLKKRKPVLEGVCISGGEPTLHNELPQRMKEIKSLGYLVKLDTNGTNPAMLANLLENHLADMVAMDIKNAPANYTVSIGNVPFDLRKIQQSIDLLLSSNIRYEFRTTLVREHHTETALLDIAKWLQGDSFYYLQNYKDSPDVRCPGLHGFNPSELAHFQQVAKQYLPNTFIRG